jgi:multicomponent Na+:H+ antiporter subunit D
LSLLAGIILQIKATGTTEFSFIGLDTLASWFIFIGVAVNAAVFPLHGWLKDAYPEATVTGAVFLSTFTTKSAVYVMARMFPGIELLIWLGAAMAIIPIFYGILENNIRRILAYCIINQVGFMLIGVGIGTELALNGAAAHAFCHILYKALLFMSAGSVLHMTGKTKCTELGGLYRTMPLTCIFGIIGAASVAFPMFCGFVSKSMTISASSHEHMVRVWLVLQIASVGAFLLAGIKVNFFTFFGKDSGLRPKEAPANMLVAMGIVAFLCVYVGINFELLYKYLPYPVHYEPYTGSHIVGQFQLLFFAALAFILMVKTGFYPRDINAENLDTDWIYRKGSNIFYFMADFYLNAINKLSDLMFVGWITGSINRFAVNAPVKLSLFLILPIKVITGNSKEQRELYKKRLTAAFEKGALPVGIGAMLSVIFLILLYASLNNLY